MGGAVRPDNYPRLAARTQRFTLGEPRNVDGVARRPAGRVRPVGRGGDDPVNCLWVLDVATGERAARRRPARAARPRPRADLPPEERARRERAREAAGGVVSLRHRRRRPWRRVRPRRPAVRGRPAVGGRPASCRSPGPCSIPGPTRPPAGSPTSAAASLRIAELDGRAVELAGATPTGRRRRSWGSAEFIAAEEMGRTAWVLVVARRRRALAVARVDTAPVARWWVADPAHPASTADRARLPGRRHRQRRRHASTSSAWTAAGSPSTGTAAPSPTWLDVHLAEPTARCCVTRAVAGPAAARGARRRP